MRIRKTLKGFDKGRDVTLLFLCASLAATRGKYLVGFHNTEKDHLVIAFDESASFHKDIALRFQLRPRGGGWLELSASKKRVRISGRSLAYGREPDRDLTRRVLSMAFPDYSCTYEP